MIATKFVYINLTPQILINQEAIDRVKMQRSNILRKSATMPAIEANLKSSILHSLTLQKH